MSKRKRKVEDWLRLIIPKWKMPFVLNQLILKIEDTKKDDEFRIVWKSYEETIEILTKELTEE